MLVQMVKFASTSFLTVYFTNDTKQFIQPRRATSYISTTVKIIERKSIQFNKL